MPSNRPDALDEAMAAYHATAPRLPQTGAQPVPQPSTGAPPPAPVAPPAPQKPQGILETLLSTVSKLGGQFDAGMEETGKSLQANTQMDAAQAAALPGIAASAPAAIARAPGQLIGGTLDTVADAGRFVDDNISGALLKAGVPKNIAKMAGSIAGGSFSLAGQGAQKVNHGASLADTLSFRQSLGQVGNPQANEFMTQAVAAMLPTGVGATGLAARSLKLGIQAGLSADVKGATPGERLVERNTVAGLGTGVGIMAEVALPLVKALIASRGVRTLSEATPHEAAADAMDRTYGTLNTQAEREAQAAAEEKPNGNGVPQGGSTVPNGDGQAVTPVSAPSEVGGGSGTAADIPQASPKSDAGGTEPSGPPEHPLAADANGLLEHAGAEERLPTDGPPPVSPAGKIVVSPESMDALEAKGTSRGFTAANSNTDYGFFDPELNAAYEQQAASDAVTGDTPQARVDRAAEQAKLIPANDHDPVIFKESDDQGGSRVVGSMDRASLLQFIEDARSAQANLAANDINTPADHPSGQWNLHPLGNSDDAAAVGRALVDRLPKDDRPVTDETLLMAARAMGFNHPNDAAILGGILSNSVEDLPQAIVAARLLSRKINDVLQGLTNTDWATVPVGDPRWEKALAAYHNGYSWMQMFRDAKSQVARALRANQIDLDGNTVIEDGAIKKSLAGRLGFTPVDAPPSQPVPDFDTYLRNFGKTPPDGLQAYPKGSMPGLPRTPQEFKDALDLLGIAHQLGPQMVNDFWKGVTISPGGWRTLSNSFANWYVASIVSRLSTFGRDLVGPAVLGGLRTVEKSTGALLQAGVNSVRRGAGSAAESAGEALASTTHTNLGGSDAKWAAPVPDRNPTPAELGEIAARHNTSEAGAMSIWNAARGAGQPIARPTVNTEKGTQAVMQAIGNATIGDSSKVAGNLAAAGDAVHMYVKTWGDVVDALKGARATLMSGHSQLGGAQPYDFSTKQIPWQMIQALSKGPLDTAGYVLGNAINLFPSAVHALHGGVNEFALNLAYNGELRTQAMMYAREKGLDGEALTDYVKGAVQAGRDPVNGQATDISALNEAQRTTFTKPVLYDPSATGPAKWAMNTLEGLQREVPIVGRMIVPILKVPANGLGEQLRRVPILNLAFRETQQALSGMHGDIAQAEAYGRMVTGGTMLGGGLMLANRGLLTGAGPANPKDRSDWEAAGFQPYSIKGPDGHWYKYNKIDVVGAMLGVMAQMHDMTVYHSTEDDTLWKQTLGATSAIAEYIKDQAALKGISDVMSFGGDPSADAGHLQQFFNGLASGMVPGFLQAVRDRIDPDKRIVRSMGDAVQNALPFASKPLDPVRNLFGQPVHVPIGEALLPVTTSEVNPNGPQSDVLNEVHRLFVASGSVPGPLSPSLPGGHKDMRDIPLEDGRSLYDARMRARSVVRADNGATIEEALRTVIQSEDYKDGYDGTVHGEESAPDGRLNRAALLNHVFQDFDTKARSAVAQYSPIAARYMAVGMMKRLNPPGASLHTTDEFVHNPALLQSLGIDIGSYEETLKGN